MKVMSGGEELGVKAIGQGSGDSVDALDLTIANSGSEEMEVANVVTEGAMDLTVGRSGGEAMYIKARAGGEDLGGENTGQGSGDSVDALDLTTAKSGSQVVEVANVVTEGAMDLTVGRSGGEELVCQVLCP